MLHYTYIAVLLLNYDHFWLWTHFYCCKGICWVYFCTRQDLSVLGQTPVCLLYFVIWKIENTVLWQALCCLGKSYSLLFKRSSSNSPIWSLPSCLLWTWHKPSLVVTFLLVYLPISIILICLCCQLSGKAVGRNNGIKVGSQATTLKLV